MANLVTRAEEALGMEDADLAKRLGVHRTTINRWRKKPSRFAKIALEKILAESEQKAAE